MSQLARLPGILLCLACSAAALPSQAYPQVVTDQQITTIETPSEVETTSIASPSHGLFAQVLSDFRHLPSWETLTILSVAGAGAAASHRFDGRVTSTLSASRSFGSVAGPGETIGAASVQFGAALATYTLGKATHKPKIVSLGGDLVRAQIVTQTLTQGIKIAAGRTRPDGTRYSFPSGHASTAFATATVLQRHLGWKAGIPAYSLATYVAASRVESRRHYLSDVAFGAALGVVAGRTVTIGRGEARFAVSPAVALGGGGVTFTWVGRR